MINRLAIGAATVSIVQGDITLERVDAIVNAANSGLRGGGGVDGAIHRAGGPSIMQECREIIERIGRLEPGKAVMTSGGDLPAKYVINTVGPVWNGGRRGEPGILASCYRECLLMAADRGLSSMAFPAISTGVYGYPLQLASTVAFETVAKFLGDTVSSLREVHFVLYGQDALEVYQGEMQVYNNNRGNI